MELGERGRIGMILPSVNTVAEPEVYRLLPRGVTSHTARMDLPVNISSEENFVRMCEVGCSNGEKAARELGTAKVDVLAFTFTAGSFFKGAGWDDEIAERMEKAGGAPCIVTSSASVRALKEMGLKRIGVGSPYAVANPRLQKYLEQKGMAVTRIEGLVLPTAVHVGRQPALQFAGLVRAVNSPDAEGVYIACTNFATLAKIDALEKEIGKPIITANQATFWAALRHLGIKDRLSGFGRLLDKY